MKKAVAMALLMAVTLTACGSKQEATNSSVSSAESAQESVVSSTEETSEDETASKQSSEAEESSVAEENNTTEESSESASEGNAEESTENQTVYPVTLTDQAGREIVITEEPKKLVSGYYISTSLLIALDLDDKLVGIEAKADKRPIYKLSAKDLIDLPNVGSAKEFDLEGCAALEPDLVILPAKLKDAAASLEELGITVMLVKPETQNQLIEMAELIAKATNTQSNKDKLVDFINGHTEMLQDKLKDVSASKVYLAGNSGILETAGSGMYQNDMITLSGGINVAAEIEDSYWVETSYEQILAWNPEYIIIAAEAGYSVEDVLQDENLQECTAVKEGKVYQIPADAEAWDSPVPSGVLGSVWLSNILHSDVISASECDEIIEEFYETFYQFKYSEK